MMEGYVLECSTFHGQAVSCSGGERLNARSAHKIHGKMRKEWGNGREARILPDSIHSYLISSHSSTTFIIYSHIFF